MPNRGVRHFFEILCPHAAPFSHRSRNLSRRNNTLVLMLFTLCKHTMLSTLRSRSHAKSFPFLTPHSDMPLSPIHATNQLHPAFQTSLIMFLLLLLDRIHFWWVFQHYKFMFFYFLSFASFEHRYNRNWVNGIHWDRFF